MLRRLREEIYGGVPEEFPTDGSPEQAAQRLAQGTGRGFFRRAVVGRVSVERVTLRRQRALFGSSSGVVFRGTFTSESGRTVLRGCFQFHPFFQALLTLWFGSLGFFSALSLVLFPNAALEQGAPWWQGMLAGVAFATAGLVFGFLAFRFLRFHKWLYRSDVSEIRDHIRDVL